MPNQSEAVNQFMTTLTHPMKAEVEAVRNIILNASEQITEHIKWNAPSFCYNGEDRVTLNLHAQDRIQLVFHRGSKVKNAQDFVFEDSTGLLEWLAADRAIIKLHNIEEVLAKKVALAEVVNQWMQATVASN
jgi:uncharacterized protein YdeI (YjbR/CyaY-like superfamily)